MSQKMNKRMRPNKNWDDSNDFEQRRTKNLNHTLHLTLEEMYTGTKRYIQVQRFISCTKCNKNESTSGISKKHTCQECNGIGYQYVTRRTRDNIAVQVKRLCKLCRDDREALFPEQLCQICRGRKIIPDDLNLEIKIGRGAARGQQIVFENEGTQEPNMRPGHVIIILEEKNHQTFERKDDDLWMTMHLDLVESLCGFEKIVTTLDDRKLRIKIPKGNVIASDKMKCIHGEGMPLFSNPNERGRLMIRFEVNLHSIAPRLIPSFITCLPPRKESSPPPPDIPIDAIESNMRNMTLKVHTDEQQNQTTYLTVDEDYDAAYETRNRYEYGMHGNVSNEQYEPGQYYNENGEQASGYNANGYEASGYQANGYEASGYQENGYQSNDYGQQYYRNQQYYHDRNTFQ